MSINLRFCPNCGDEKLQWDYEKKWSCDCGFVLFHNVAGAVAVVVRCGDEIMLTKRNQEPKKGFWDLAGGFVDPNESAETTCERELFEELALSIDPKNLKYLASYPNVYHYKGIDYNTLDLFYEYELNEKRDFSLELSEISEIVWLKLAAIDPDKMPFASQKKFFENYQL